MIISSSYEKYLMYLRDGNMTVEERAGLIDTYSIRRLQSCVCQELQLAMRSETNLGVRQIYAKSKFLNPPICTTPEEKAAVLIFAIKILRRLGIEPNELFDLCFSQGADYPIEELPYD